jgi:uncharacterized protein YggE
MRKILFTLTTLLIVSKVSAAEVELKGSSTELASYLATVPKLVSISGESELKVTADRANVSLRVLTEQKTLQETLRANQEARAKFISWLKERGVPADRIQVSKFSSTTKTGVFTDKAKSYRVENVLNVKVQDEKEFQAVAHAVDAMPEVFFHGVTFEQSDKEPLRNKALDQALDNASQRKHVFEEKLNVKLTPKSFSIISTGSGRSQDEARMYRYAEPALSSEAKRTTALPSYGSARGDGAVSEESGPLFGELVFTARVTVEYAVESK